MKLIATFFMIVFLMACDGHKAEVGRIDTLVKIDQVGSSQDFWFEKQIFTGEWERTALVFGYGNDFSACRNLVEAWEAKYPEDTYRCSPAN